MDAQINKYTRGHLLFLYEEDDDGVSLDEGTIFLGGIRETYGLYLLAGKYYPHFGELNSLENVQLAARYEGPDDLYDLFPEDPFGFAVSWELSKNTTLSGEYLHGEYEDNATTVDREQDIFTMQFAVGF